MAKVINKIAFPIILAGFFIITSFLAIEYDKLDIGFYIVFLFIAIYLFLFGFAIGEKLSSPVKKLLQRAKQLSEGDLTTRIYLDEKDEFGELALAFNKIADNLQESNAEIESTKKAVDIKVRAKTEALEETINALEQKIKNRTIELEKTIEESKNLKDAMAKKDEEIAELRGEIKGLKEFPVKQKSKKVAPKKASEIETQEETI